MPVEVPHPISLLLNEIISIIIQPQNAANTESNSTTINWLQVLELAHLSH